MASSDAALTPMFRPILLVGRPAEKVLYWRKVEE